MKLQNPLNYSSQETLIKALKKVSQTAMNVKTAIWLQNTKYALIDKFNYSEKDAAQLVFLWTPKTSAYAACGRS